MKLSNSAPNTNIFLFHDLKFKSYKNVLTIKFFSKIMSLFQVMTKNTLSCKSFESASDVLDLAICSNHLPREMNRNNMGGVSKKVIGEAFSCIIILASTTPQLYEYAIVVARTTNTSIFVVPCLIAAQAYQYSSIIKFS